MPNCVRLALTVGFMLFSAACQSRQEVSPGLEPQQEDFARARNGFKTRLVRQGPSPQPGGPLQTPSGATEKAPTTSAAGNNRQSARHPFIRWSQSDLSSAAAESLARFECQHRKAGARIGDIV